MIQLVITLFIVFILWRTALRWRSADITGREFAVWVFFWSMIVLASFIPAKTDKLAQFVGVERGADFFVYISIIVLFFVLFTILVQLQTLKRDITKLVRKDAIFHALEQDKNKENNNV